MAVPPQTVVRPKPLCRLSMDLQLPPPNHFRPNQTPLSSFPCEDFLPCRRMCIDLDQHGLVQWDEEERKTPWS